MVLAGLVLLAGTPMAAAAGRSKAKVAAKVKPVPKVKVAAKVKPVPKASGKLDAVIDISHMTNVSDFHLARKRSNILGVIHKASEGGDWSDPLYAKRRAQAEAAGLLWGAYHYGTHQYSGAKQAAMFLGMARPGPATLMALDLEFNEQNPSNTMQLRQAEDFVQAVVAATGRHPLIYINAAWADGEPMGDAGRSLGDGITERSILARCPLWLADYRSQPEVPSAWQGQGWRFWQYAGDTEQGGPRGGRVSRVLGIDRCDRNIFHGDAAALHRFWQKEAGRLPSV
jgi:lysozyme